MKALIKITLAILFFLCLLDMPYGFFMLVRVIAIIGFAILAYQAREEAKIEKMIVYIALILLFQPLYKIALGRQLWNIVDVVVGVGLLLSIFIKSKKR